MTKLSVIIVNYNVKYFLEHCLYSVQSATKNTECEIIVVDNNSIDGSVKMIEEKFPFVKVIANKDNKGFSSANNQAIKIAQGEYVLLLNPDTVVEEDTFKKIVDFMDATPDAGGLGVKMIDGKGNFLPESKRGLPTPEVAFYKMSGLATMLPKSKRFGKYHLGYLDKDEIHKVEILSGAFMLLRKSVLDKIGLLDETFFMYGEDIDLSYRIIKEGYNNYYFPETSIIHYKGESTKKSSTNYVFVFYNAMIIFAQKHFSQKNARLFSLFINLAIYLRASVAIAKRLFSKIAIPFFDVVTIYLSMLLIKDYWEKNVVYPDGGHFPEALTSVIIPFYIISWIVSVFFSGGYDRPFKVYKLARGIVFGLALILMVYALLDESYRFSRAMILLGTVSAFFSMLLIRVIRNLIKYKKVLFNENNNLKIAILGYYEESSRVAKLIKSFGVTPEFIGYITPDEEKDKDNGIECLGTINQLSDIISIYNIDELIFCSKDVSAHNIITQMSELEKDNVSYKIAPPEGMSIIGSNSINTAGELYVINVNSVSHSNNKRNKVMLDIMFSLLVILFSPILYFYVKSPRRIIRNSLAVIFQQKSWVGYIDSKKNTHKINNEILVLPKIKKGVLNPAHAIDAIDIDDNTISKLNMLYAKNYSVYKDMNIIWKALRFIGGKG